MKSDCYEAISNLGSVVLILGFICGRRYGELIANTAVPSGAVIQVASCVPFHPEIMILVSEAYNLILFMQINLMACF